MQKQDKVVIGSILILLIFGVYYNLGYLPFRSDDGLRGLVAFEMDQTGEYVVPHLWGDLYLNKPPLFNWLIVGATKLFGNWSNFSIRFATATSLLVFGYLIYYYLKNEYTNKLIPIITALASITTATIFYEDAHVAEIDISFSLLIYGCLMSVYKWFGKNHVKLFAAVYVFGALAFMMKGFPSLVFIGFTLLAWFTWNKRFKDLISWAHVFGVLIFLIILSTYYYAYISRMSNGQFSLDGAVVLLRRLWDESTMRTVDNYTPGDYLFNFFRFPVRFLSSLLPWSILIIPFFFRGARRLFRESKLLQFYALTFTVNIWIYWISPGNNLRYTLMFIPLIVGILVHVYFELRRENHKSVHIVDSVLRYGGFVLPAALILSYFLSLASGSIVVLMTFIVVGSFLSFKLFRRTESVILYFMILVVFAKCAYVVLFLPTYADSIKERRFENLALAVAKDSKNHHLWIYADCEIKEDITLYLARERNEVIKRVRNTDDRDAWYVVDIHGRTELEKFGLINKIHGEFESRKIDRKLFVVELFPHKE